MSENINQENNEERIYEFIEFEKNEFKDFLEQLVISYEYLVGAEKLFVLTRNIDELSKSEELAELVLGIKTLSEAVGMITTEIANRCHPITKFKLIGYGKNTKTILFERNGVKL